MQFPVPPIINAAGLIPFLAQLGSVPNRDPEIILDFSALRRVSPAGLVALVASVRRWQKPNFARVKFLGLENCPICDYLQRMDVLSACGITWAETFRRHPAHGRFVPVQCVENVDRLSREVASCLAPGGEDLEHPLSPLYDLAAYVLGELGANVRQHSRGIGFVAAQNSLGEGLVRMAVADNGTGVRQTFVDAGFSWSHGMSDAAALMKALEARVSSKGEPFNQGVGLTLVSGLARLTEAWLLIGSGTGLLQMDPSGAITEGTLPDNSHYDGTLVALTFRRDKLQDFPTLLDEAKKGSGLLAKRPVKPTFT